MIALASVGASALKNWKLFVGAGLIVVVALFFMHYKNVKDANKLLTDRIADMDYTVKQKNSTIDSLKEANIKQKEELTRYIKLYETILDKKNKLQVVYNGLLEEVNNYEPKVDETGSIVEPIVIIPGGVPKEAMPGYYP